MRRDNKWKWRGQRMFLLRGQLERVMCEELVPSLCSQALVVVSFVVNVIQLPVSFGFTTNLFTNS